MGSMENEKSLHVLYGCDDNYAPYVGISMTSLFESNRHLDRIVVYVAGMGISPENCRKYQQTARRYRREVVMLDAERAMDRIRRYHCGGWNGSLATWLRFFVFDQIPEQVERLLWLDSDTVVAGDLGPLCELDMQGEPVACVCDAQCHFGRTSIRLGRDRAYFNAGVILFDLSKWRARDIVSGMMDRVRRYAACYPMNDQDLLNDYFRGHVYQLPVRYNLQGIHLACSAAVYRRMFPQISKNYYPTDELDRAIRDPVVVHFVRFFGDYPWATGYNPHPAKSLYEQWRDRSLWSGHVGHPCDGAFLFRLERGLYRYLPEKAFLCCYALAVWLTDWRNNAWKAKKLPDQALREELYR